MFNCYSRVFSDKDQYNKTRQLLSATTTLVVSLNYPTSYFGPHSLPITPVAAAFLNSKAECKFPTLFVQSEGGLQYICSSYMRSILERQQSAGIYTQFLLLRGLVPLFSIMFIQRIRAQAGTYMRSP